VDGREHRHAQRDALVDWQATVTPDTIQPSIASRRVLDT